MEARNAYKINFRTNANRQGGRSIGEHTRETVAAINGDDFVNPKGQRLGHG